MKPKKASILNGPRISFSFLPLYLAELRFMVELSKEKSFLCAISDDEHDYDDLTDLVNHCGNRVRNLSIQFSKANSSFDNVTVKVTPSGVVLSANGTDDFIALEQRLRTYLKKRSPWFAFLINPWIWFPILTLLAPFIATSSNRTQHPLVWNILEPTFYIVMVILPMSYAVPFFFGGVYLKKKDEITGPFAKYEKVIIAVVSAIVAVFGKWFLDNHS